jgi:hypothetical protein
MYYDDDGHNRDGIPYLALLDTGAAPAHRIHSAMAALAWHCQCTYPHTAQASSETLSTIEYWYQYN